MVLGINIDHFNACSRKDPESRERLTPNLESNFLETSFTVHTVSVMRYRNKTETADSRFINDPMGRWADKVK